MPIPPAQRFDGLETGQLRRCPGAASQPAADGSAPWRDSERHARLRSGPGAAGAVMRALPPSPPSSWSPPRWRRGRCAAAGDDDGYRVRAIFDNAGFVIPGEDVKVAGVKVGSIDAVEVTPDFKAAVVLRIDDPGYQDFRADARCRVRPQSLIGERFVECEPTQRAGRGAEAPGAAAADRRAGRARASTCCPSTARSTTVDLDLINDIMRRALPRAAVDHPQRARHGRWPAAAGTSTR